MYIQLFLPVFISCLAYLGMWSIKRYRNYASQNCELLLITTFFNLLGFIIYIKSVTNFFYQFLFAPISYISFGCAILSIVLMLLLFVLDIRKRDIANIRWLQTGQLRKTIITYFKQHNEDVRSYPKRIISILIPVITLVYMIYVFGVLEPFFANIVDWLFTLSDILMPLLVVSFVWIAILVCGIPIFIKGDNLKLVANSIVALCFCFYIQNAFLNRKMFIDGTIPLWSTVLLYSNLILFVFIIILAVVLSVKKMWAHKFFMCIATVMLIMQLSPLPFLFLNSPSEAFTHKTEMQAYDLSGENQFTVSTQENVIVFIIDTYDQEGFSALLDAYPDLKENFNDFVCFDDVNTKSWHTAFSMPYMLTAHDFDFDIDLQESNKRAWESSTADYFYDSMHNAGYMVNLYTDSAEYSGGAENMIGKIDNIVPCKKTYDTDGWKTYQELVRLSKYRYYPYLLKYPNWISGEDSINKYTDTLYNDAVVNLDNWQSAMGSANSRGVDYMNYDFYRDLKKGLSVVDDRKMCSIYHLSGMHEPYVYIDEAVGYVDYNTAQYGCLSIMFEMVRQLKEMGIYDTSTIIFTADHGKHEIMHSNPVMLIKQANYTGDGLIYSSVPGDIQEDFLATILYSVGIDNSPLGRSLYEINENETRERIVRQFGYRYDLPNAKKCTSVGNACYNFYREYHYTDVPFNPENEDYEDHPITSYWW